jgi:AAA15 family ATPase/GTPase
MNKQRLSLLHSGFFKNLRLNDGISLNDLNIFIGPNCSGKSNFISMLKFLKDCIVASSEDDQGGKYENAISQLGGSNILSKDIKTPADVNFCFHFSETDTIPKGLNLNIQLFVGARDSKVTIKQESLSDSIQVQSTPFYYYKYHDREIGKGVVSYYDNSYTRKSHFE